jgi:hypothetical protein
MRLVTAGARHIAVCVLALLAGVGATTACRDVSRFSSKGDRFEGTVVKGNFVRSGVVEDARICLTLDTDHLQDAPGTITTSDGRFRSTPLRPIPQIWHDPLSTFTFGDGRVQNLVYAAAPLVLGDAGVAEAQDVMVIVSLMQANHIEVRFMRGAPQTDAGPPPPGVGNAVFAVFNLDRESGPCAF